MPIDPTILTVTELVDGMRKAAVGDLRREAAAELLIRHWTWLARPDFVATCMRVATSAGDLVEVDWALVASYATLHDADPADRAIAKIAAQLAGHPTAGSGPSPPTRCPRSGGCSRTSTGATSRSSSPG